MIKAPNILEALIKIPLPKMSAKLSFLAILKISCKILKNGGGVGKKVMFIFKKSRTEILAIFGSFYGIKWLNWKQFSYKSVCMQDTFARATHSAARPSARARR